MMGEKPDFRQMFLQFFENYPLAYWEVKLKLLRKQLEDFDSQKEKLEQLAEFKNIPDFKTHYQTMLNFDLHFIKFQIFEALFSMIFALEEQDDEMLWFNLSFPKSSSQRSFAVYDKIGELNHYGLMKGYLEKHIRTQTLDVPFWQYLFFFNVAVTQLNKDIPKIAENIALLLLQMASSFCDRDDFNSYKHALRCFGVNDFRLSITPEGSDTIIPVGSAKYGIRYLRKDDKGIIYNTFKAISPNEDLYYIEQALQLLSNLINTRKNHFARKENNVLFFFASIEKNYPIEYTAINFSLSVLSEVELCAYGNQAYQQRKFDEAIYFYRKTLQIDESDKNIILNLANAYFAQKEYEKAIPLFETYLKNSMATHRKDALFKKGFCHYFARALKEANNSLQECLRDFEAEGDKDPRIAEVRYMLAAVKLQLNQQYFSRTGKNKLKYVILAQKLLQKAERHKITHPETWFQLAIVLQHLNKYKESKEIYEKLDKNFPPNRSNLLCYANIALDEGDLEKAEDLLKKAKELDESYSNTWNMIALLAQKRGNFVEMKQACEKSLTYSKNDEEKKLAFLNLGKFYDLQGDSKEAIEGYKKSLLIDGNYLPARMGLLDVEFGAKKYDAVLEITKSDEISKTNFLLLNKRIYALIELGNYPEAIEIVKELLKKCVDDNEKLVNLYDTMGDILKKQGDNENAIVYYNKSLESSEKEYPFTPETRSKLRECEKTVPFRIK